MISIDALALAGCVSARSGVLIALLSTNPASRTAQCERRIGVNDFIIKLSSMAIWGVQKPLHFVNFGRMPFKPTVGGHGHRLLG